MFYLNGKSNIELGVIAVEEDFLSVAATRYSEILIDGRDGAIYEQLGRANVVYNVVLQVIDVTKIDELKSLLKSTVELSFNDRKTYFEVNDECVIVRNGSSLIFNLPIVRHPYWYALNEEFELVNGEVINLGNEISKPIIKLIGDDTIDISINNTRFIYNFDEDKEVIIDCDKKTETYQNLSKSKNIEIGFSYPTLDPGSNLIIIHSGSPIIYIKRKDCWL